MLVSRFEGVWEPFSSEALIDFLGLCRGEQDRARVLQNAVLAVFTPGQDEGKETCWSSETKTEG